MLINLKTQERVWEHDFRSAHPEVSFPKVIADGDVAAYGFAVLSNDSAPKPAVGFKAIDAGQELVGGAWRIKFEEVPLADDEIEGFAMGVRSERDFLLSASDWTQGKDIPDAVSAQWAEYRQALRDITSQSGFPFEVIWPAAPM